MQDIFIFDAYSLQAQNLIHAHKGPISQLAIDPTGCYLASCSTKGTVVRVSPIPKFTKFQEYRRGTIPAIISSISFNHDATMLCVASTNGTVHIFSLKEK